RGCTGRRRDDADLELGNDRRRRQRRRKRGEPKSRFHVWFLPCRWGNDFRLASLLRFYLTKRASFSLNSTENGTARRVSSDACTTTSVARTRASSPALASM